MTDLFASTGGLKGEHLELAGADVTFAREFLPQPDAKALFCELLDSTPWRAVEISVWGKKVMQPRLISWFGDPAASYKYSGVRLDPEPWTSTLLTVRRMVEDFALASFNSVLLNLYRDQNDSMGWHSDDEPDLGDKPTIASLSLGETRDFLMRHKHRKDISQVSLPLSSGSLLVMAGDTQKNWAHSIRKETAKLMPRINLTFRHVLPRQDARQQQRRTTRI